MTNNIDNLKGSHPSDTKPWLFKPGQSGNPGGYPAQGPSLTKVLREYLLEHPQDLLDILIATIDAAKRGKFEHLNLIWNRLDGKLVETHQIESENPVTLVFVPAYETKKVDVEAEATVLGVLETETIPQHSLGETNATSEALDAKKTGLAMLPVPPKTVVGQPWTGDGPPPGWTRTRVERSNNE